MRDQAVLPSVGRLDAGLGTDFSDVRVHQGTASPEIGALAYTQGSPMFGAGGAAGDGLVGHELAHVVQQRQGRVSPTAGVPSGAPFAHYAD